ncbi:lytic murein transglycosylase [Roseibium aggregatum]|uniref:Lytic murein transglycosylase n=1 Tax=Roseibium aggregatum TaxID=187304 RepID=A0A939EDV6_9HYPH|nr:lytic murein transglycosylase [Roseibium aggregatum]MBN9671402.1 lytic murein transglycosylase [Roseibium aggregatum]
MRFLIVFVFGLAVLSASPAFSASCGNGPGGFEAWKQAFIANASSYGLKQRVVKNALKNVSYNPKVVRLDRNQKSFKLSFNQFYAKRVNNAMIRRGQKLGKTYQRMFNGIERKYGVPAPVILAIWGLETNYGSFSGNMSVLRSLSTLAYDCRRSAFFTNELVNALIIVQRRDMTPAEMKGAWAGELGQTQFLASSYVKYAVDYDRNGRRDLIRSIPDVLASTANYLAQKGWRRGQGWGPGTANYNVLRQWNKASVYVQTISVMADKIAQ